MNKACCYIHIFYRDKKQGIDDVSMMHRNV